jgi:hypothetical protein
MSIQLLRRNFLQKELQIRVINWKNKEFQKNYSVHPNNPIIADFGIERDDNGYYYMSDRVVSYCDLRNGMIYRIKKNFQDTDWLCYNELYQAGITSGKFRIDIPIFREETVLDNTTWEYVELQSPNRDYGYNFNDDVFSWPELTDGLIPNASIDAAYKNSVKDYFTEYFNQSLDLIQAAVQISEANSCGMPKGLCEASNRYKDTVGYFWSDIDHEDWNLNKSEMMIIHLEVFGATLGFAYLCGCLDQEQIEELLTYAREKWTTI